MRSSFQHISAVSFRVLHRGSAIMLALFLLIHLGNHFAGLGGQDTHIMFMEVVRRLYRNALVEPILIALILFQLGTGLTMAIRGWRARSGFVVTGNRSSVVKPPFAKLGCSATVRHSASNRAITL